MTGLGAKTKPILVKLIEDALEKKKEVKDKPKEEEIEEEKPKEEKPKIKEEIEEDKTKEEEKVKEKPKEIAKEIKDLNSLKRTDLILIINKLNPTKRGLTSKRKDELIEIIKENDEEKILEIIRKGGFIMDDNDYDLYGGIDNNKEKKEGGNKDIKIIII